jgi:hypothetical protein
MLFGCVDALTVFSRVRDQRRQKGERFFFDYADDV